MADPKDAVLLDPDLVWRMRQQWLAAIELAVWGHIKCEQLGLLGKLRRRILDLGERLKSLEADRLWIPQERERIKNLLGSCLAAHDALLLAEKTAQSLTDGPDTQKLRQALTEIQTLVTGELQAHENRWAETLQHINKNALSDEDE